MTATCCYSVPMAVEHLVFVDQSRKSGQATCSSLGGEHVKAILAEICADCSIRVSFCKMIWPKPDQPDSLLWLMFLV